MTRNRGKHPNDDKIFAQKWQQVFSKAADDMGYLLSREYGTNEAIALVGNHYKLNKRQRTAIQRISVGDQQIQKRKEKQLEAEALAGQEVGIDGFNLLILLENALSGAYIFKCRDGVYRDISGIHGSYKKVLQTTEAIELIGNALIGLGVGKINWYLDTPVSNSGRLKVLLAEIAEQNKWEWNIELVNNPDKVLAESGMVVISSDGIVLERAAKWFNFGAYIIEKLNPGANIINA